jgi:uncharacterized RDD family membrane protein YckC
VVNLDGSPAVQASLLRRAAVYPAAGFLLGGVCMLIPGFTLGLVIGLGYAVAMAVPILTDSLGRGLHDRWSGTIVVKAHPAA